MALVTMGDYFAGHGMVIEGLMYLSPREALPLLEGAAVLVDLREHLEKNGRQFEVSSVVAIPFSELEASYERLPRDKPLILADCVGLKSKEGLRFLAQHGFQDAASLIGGIVDWERDGMPTSINRDEELTGSCVCRLRRRGLTP